MDAFRKGTGIVCEYNPFHKGHAYQIETLKKAGAKFIVCAMSGDFVQRGEPAFQEKLVRARNAVNSGADIVLEIPFPFSSFSAEGFAKAGISVLENSGLCSSFGFGSECADAEKLSKIADILTPSFHRLVINKQKEEPNLSYAAAREMLIEQQLSKEFAEIIKNPNDILGVEYLKANKSLVPIAVKRETPRGGCDELFASSSYIRRNFYDTNGDAAKWLPEGYDYEGIRGDTQMFYNHVLLSLMQKTPQSLSGIAEVMAGLEHSIIKKSAVAQSYEELLKLLASKTTTDAKIRRMLLFAFFGITKEMAKTAPLYTEVLAVSDTGKKMLKKYADDRKMIVASRIAEIKRNKEAYEQYCLSRRAGEVFEKCLTIAR